MMGGGTDSENQKSVTDTHTNRSTYRGGAHLKIYYKHIRGGRTIHINNIYLGEGGGTDN